MYVFNIKFSGQNKSTIIRALILKVSLLSITLLKVDESLRYLVLLAERGRFELPKGFHP